MDILKVVITGPESTGKTILAERLASHFNTLWIPEYARDYILNLGRKYCFSDIETIAREQIRLEKNYLQTARNILFYDTHLIVTKVWFMVVYDRYPVWIDEAIKSSGIDLFLICDTDIPWVPDPVRENGGEMRQILMKMYKAEIESFGVPWRLVSGKGEQRITSAIEKVTNFF